jgi:hypothetical protein
MWRGTDAQPREARLDDPYDHDGEPDDDRPDLESEPGLPEVSIARTLHW